MNDRNPVNWLKRPSTTGGVIYLAVVASVCVGMGIVAAGQWRPGVVVMGIGFGVAFAARCVLPDNRAGMLRVRRRLVDLATIGLCSGGMLLLAALIPLQH